MQNQSSSLIVVSNRLPISLHCQDDRWEIKPSTGGLASALTGVQEKIDFTWIGWPGASLFENQKEEVKNELQKQKLIPIFLNKEQEEHFYHTFCNSILWPLFHYFTDPVTHSCQSWEFYEEVNQIFANEVIQQANFNSTVWVHDFHLMLLPSLLRKKRPDLKIGFFLHIPFPSSEIYRMFPKRELLLKGLLGADYIGFHTSDYARHFRLACLRVLGADTTEEGVIFQGRKTGVGAHPIGMNIASFDKILSSENYSSYINEIKSRYQNQKVILGVERLDYTKGILLKLQAFERCLEKNPELIGQIVLLQIIVPSRHSSQEYQHYRSEVEQAISRLNGKYSKPGFIPVQYLYRHLPLDELVALFCLADICMIASIRDGMNLVAQEFVYSASHMKETGVLLLSEFAGASHHLPHATLINPLDIEGMADQIQVALQMPTKEKKSKIDKMASLVKGLDSPIWAAKFLEKLELMAQKNSSLKLLFGLNEKQYHYLIKRSTHANQRIFILDYDGTLQELENLPMKAAPSRALLKILERLALCEETEVHIVSGRDSQTLQSWFGHLPIALAAGHGYQYKEAHSNDWNILRDCEFSWKGYVQEILNKVVEEVPGSFLEFKESSICWHYRLSDLDYGQWRAKELYTSLMHDLANHPVEVIAGKKIIEVRAQGVSKGNYVRHLLKSASKDPFILCIGDDRSDEEMYAALPKKAISIHVGERCQNSTYQLESPLKVRELLSEISAALYQTKELSLE